MGRPWPFVGREAELATIRRALRDRSRAGVVLAGPPGVGKTRLARAVMDMATSGGGAARWVMATASAARIPLGAMSQLLPHWADAPVDTHLLPHAARVLLDGAEGRRLVLGVDDAHLLDPTSATLVHHLAVTGSAFVVMTVRTGVRVPDPMFGLWKEGVATRVDILQLDRERTDRVVCEALGGQVDGATLHQLWELSLGNPLFVRELVEGGRTGGALAEHDGVWRWEGPLTPTPRLTELIDARMGALTGDERAALEIVAFGEPLGVDLATRLTSADSLEGAEREGLVVSERLGRRLEVRLAHPLYGEVLRSRTSPLRERAVYTSLAEGVGTTGSSRADDQLRMVTWRLAAGLPTEERLLRETAVQTMKVDYRAAERLARAAVDQGGGFDAAFLLGQILVGLGRPAEAEDVFAGAVEEADTDDRRTDLAVARVANLYWGVGAPRRAAEILSGIDTSRGAAPMRDELATLGAALLLHEGSSTLALATVDPMVRREGPGDSTTLQAYAVATSALRGRGRFDAALDVAERGRALARAVDDPTAAWALLLLETGRCDAHAFAGRLDEAEALAQLGYQEALDGDRLLAKALYAGWLGIVASLRGRVRTAGRWLRDATSGVGPGAFPFLPVLAGELAQAAAIAGEPATADAALDLTDRALAQSSGAAGPWTALSRAWGDAVRGRVDRAVVTCLEAAQEAEERGQVQTLLLLLHGVVRFGAADRVVERLTAVASRCEGAFAEACGDHGRALAAGDAGALDGIAERFGTLGLQLVAAECAAQAAHLHHERGRAGAAAASSMRARRCAEACEGAVTPALALLDTGGLTKREHEIALLAASGMTSRAIAEHLVVSVRTVDNVLHGVYHKLGVAGRRELGSVVGARAGS